MTRAMVEYAFQRGQLLGSVSAAKEALKLAARYRSTLTTEERRGFDEAESLVRVLEQRLWSNVP